MKTRLGFVSNSSSSSFVLGVKGDEAKVTLKVEVDLTRFADHTIKNEKDLEEYMDDYFGRGWKEEMEECEWTRNRYNQAKEVLDKGMNVIVGRVCSDSSDNPLEVFLYESGIAQHMDGCDDFIVIQDAEC